MSKKVKNPHGYPLAIIKWIDSAKTPNWTFITELDAKPVVCFSVGWIVSANKKTVTVVPHLSSDYSSIEQQGCGAMTIPVCSVLSIKQISK